MNIIYDTFTNGNTVSGTSHTGEWGATWTLHASYSGTVPGIFSNRLYGKDTANAVVYTSGVPVAADYEVTGDIYIASTANCSSGVAGRIDTSAATMYYATLVPSTGVVTLGKTVAATVTSLGTYTATVSATNTYTLKLQMIGTALTVFLDDVSRVTATDSAITATGRAGARFGGTVTGTTTTGGHIDTFWGDDLLLARPPQIVSTPGQILQRQ